MRRLVSRGDGVGVVCSNEPVEVRPRASCRALDVETPRARRRRERRRLRNAASVAPDDDVRGIGEGPPIQVRHGARVAHGLGPIELRLVAEVVNQMGDGLRPDKVDAERLVLAQVRGQMLPNQRRLGRHKNGARNDGEENAVDVDV